MASIRIEDEARKDPRFGILGKRLGTTKFDARARMEELWAYCTDRHTYYLAAEVIDELTEFPGFHQHIIDSELAEQTDKGIRIRGTKGRIEWLRKLRNNGKKGGRPKKTKEKPDGNQNVTGTEPPPNPLTLVIVPSPVPVQNLEREAVVECTLTWSETLEKFGIKRAINQFDETQITQACLKYGPDYVLLALFGARYEQDVEGFKVKNHLSLGLVFVKDKQGNSRIEKFVNLGAQNQVEKPELFDPEAT